ncbi:type 1 glutamine amidotransferase [Cellulomonas sp. KRMCY2]|uniref:type 1 glutamine amidotransferase n=1 Tax=Cellulomonas sp. KRMCY2 TaxID=1304865 RepID=UPI0004AE2ADA|nr:type 1 glutamine amidotransferase [Cellulomonas sp. KRMCY2]
MMSPPSGGPRPVLVLQHVPSEGPGLIARAIDGVPRITRIVLDEPDPALPAVTELAGLVVLGGPMDADDDIRFPGLPTERRLVADAVAAEVPVLAVCLGMQLLAVALGARLTKDHGTEIGFAPVDVVAHDPVLAPLGDRPTVLHWHRDAVDLPPGATLLASSPRTPVQAFRAGSALGLQFHLEVEPGLLDEWLRSGPMATDLALHHVTDLPAQAAAALPVLVPRAVAGLTAFASAVRERA